MALVVIGDVHGRIKEYQKIANQFEYTLALGDVTFNYSDIQLDPSRHLINLGNHNNYDTAYLCPNVLKGEFGLRTHGGVEFFFVRGAFSIDLVHRQINYLNSGHKTWWEQEELSLTNMINCLESYKNAQPKTVLTHTCPASVKDLISNPKIMVEFGWTREHTSKTQELLELMFEAHQPELWVFGHFHTYFEEEINGTKFICLPELGTLTIED